MILATGNLTEVKGYKYLISAIYELAKKNIRLKCFIAGQGELEKDLEEQANRLGIQRSVKLLGYRDDIPSLLAATDIFVMPSLNEALGYSLLEAIAAGIPAIASTVGGIPEVITHDREGLLVQPENISELSEAIEKLVVNSELRRRMALNGRETAKKRFSLNIMLAQTQKVFIENLNAQKRHIT